MLHLMLALSPPLSAHLWVQLLEKPKDGLSVPGPPRVAIYLKFRPGQPRLLTENKS